jgi:hypothetical protein
MSTGVTKRFRAHRRREQLAAKHGVHGKPDDRDPEHKGDRTAERSQLPQQTAKAPKLRSRSKVHKAG